MSFILDALKKSESDRQRQSGPALFEVKVAPPKTRFPIWAVAIVALLAINLTVVGWMLLRRPAPEKPPEAAQPSQRTSPQGSAAQAAARPAPVSQDGTSPGAAIQGSTAQSPAQQAPAPQALPTQGLAAQGEAPQASPESAQARTAPTQASERTSTPAEGQVQAPYPSLASRLPASPTLSQTPPQPASAGRAAAALPSEPQGNPDDYAPATEPGSPLFKGHVKRGTEEGLPLYQDAATTPGANLPELRLDLHVYAARAQDRFALINMHKMHEGDSLPDGTRVDTITPDGVILSRNGSRFFLPRD